MVDKITPAGMPELGIIEAKTTSFGGHPPEFWAERLTEKIVGYSEDTRTTYSRTSKSLQRCYLSGLFDLYKKCVKIL
tara:strand:+ start:2284 stop:2514 length:231 start_codon:yes stop_codon:yes gene_type:complete